MPYITSVERIGLQRGEQIGLQRGEQIGLQRGEQIGLQRGEQIGLREGKLEGQRAMLRRLVQVRFGSVPEALGRQIDAADEPRLDQLADQLGAATSLDELDARSGHPA
jgi:hypothetical protein